MSQVAAAVTLFVRTMGLALSVCDVIRLRSISPAGRITGRASARSAARARATEIMQIPCKSRHTS